MGGHASSLSAGIAGGPDRRRLGAGPTASNVVGSSAIRWLDDHDIQYEKIDVIADDAAFEEMVRLSGQEMAPVLEVEGKILADFGPEELPGFFERLKR